jgi:pyruvyltransferase
MQSIDFRNLVGRRHATEGQSYPQVELVHAQTGIAAAQIEAALVSRILGSFNHLLQEQTAAPARLLVAGASMHLARDDDTVWCAGIGSMESMSGVALRRLDVRAVRGPMTREWLERRGIWAPEVFGNPLLLLPRLLPGRFRASGRRPYAVVADPEDFSAELPRSGLVSSQTPWNIYVESIVEASFIVSATIEGLAIAEAFGIPARHLDGDGRKTLELDDYAFGTGRERQGSGRSIQEALEMGGMPPPALDEQALLDAFPIDLWRDTRGAMHDDAAS